MKKMIALVLALTMLGCLAAGCSSSAPAATTAATTEGATSEATEAAAAFTTVTPGVLTVALSPDFAPMEFVDPSQLGQDMFVGFDVTLAKFIAEKLGLELVIMPMSFDACQTAVYAGTVDMSISGFSWTEEREQNYNMSDYYHAGDNEDEQILITLASNGDKYATAEALVGVKIGAQNASLQMDLVQSQLPDSVLVPIGDIGTAVLQLKNGDFECLAVADGNGEAIIAANPELAKTGFNFYVDPKQTGNVILLQKGNDALTAAVNEVLAVASEYYGEWYDAAKEVAGIEVSYDDNGVAEN